MKLEITADWIRELSAKGPKDAYGTAMMLIAELIADSLIDGYADLPSVE